METENYFENMIFSYFFNTVEIIIEVIIKPDS